VNIEAAARDVLHGFANTNFNVTDTSRTAVDSLGVLPALPVPSPDPDARPDAH
jgi:hypothetical protein